MELRSGPQAGSVSLASCHTLWGQVLSSVYTAWRLRGWFSQCSTVMGYKDVSPQSVFLTLSADPVYIHMKHNLILLQCLRLTLFFSSHPGKWWQHFHFPGSIFTCPTTLIYLWIIDLIKFIICRCEFSVIHHRFQLPGVIGWPLSSNPAGTDPPPLWSVSWMCLQENRLLPCLQTQTEMSITHSSILLSSNQWILLQKPGSSQLNPCITLNVHGYVDQSTKDV